MNAHAHKIFLLLSGAAFAAACSLVVPEPGPPVPGRAGVFPHVIHAEDGAGMACTDCHAGAESEVRAGMPDFELCGSCHELEADPDLPLAAQPAGFVLPGDSAPTWSSVTAYPIESRFSHAVHVGAGAECATCHEGVASSEATDWGWKVRMADCLECHDAEGEDVGGCAGCHPEVDRDLPPSTHGGESWLRAHGPLGAMGAGPSGAAAQDCALCHTEASCDSCHSKTLPVDHNEPWRVRGHGFSAAMDRDRCDTCHREDSCERCHQSTSPVTHRGIWANGTNAHCGSCHLPLGPDDGCATCHRGTPSHRLAAPLPGGTHPGAASDCRSCHFPLDHFDNGQACTLCHR
jgi:hypothetical protein